MLGSELRILWHLLRGLPPAATHAEQLERFYAPQAGRYDAFRERLLNGRENLVSKLDLHAGERVIELGAGTGRNAEYYGPQVPQLESLTLVDLCPSLLAKARERVVKWPNAEAIEADVTIWEPTLQADKVYFSYALTMIPDWFLAIDNAIKMLRPGGLLGVVDFYVSRNRPSSGLVRHPLWQRSFWPMWFGHDGVNLSPDHLPYLRSKLSTVALEEHLGAVPFLPGLKVPYYVFVGRKAGGD
jgi:S-adenosylmethionine-diacylgycerolhomoserine-N-methlytransferase